MVSPISKAQARQRCGRAGREVICYLTCCNVNKSAGKCFRLYTEDTFHNLAENTIPEIKRCNLATVILQMKTLGIENILAFDYLEPPPQESGTTPQVIGFIDFSNTCA